MSFSIREEGTNSQQTITLCDDQTGTTAQVFCFGALLNAFTIQTEDHSVNVIDGFKNVDDAKAEMNNGFKSAKLSPFVCRMREGKYQFQDTEFKVQGFHLNGHAIHGLLCHAVFELTDSGADEDKAWATLTHEYKGTDKGYPFPYTIVITWTLHKNHYLTVTTTATNLHNGMIPFADGWHPYFSTDTGVDSSILSFNTSRKLVFDDELVPTGAEEKDDRFLAGALLDGIELDNCFVLPDNEKGYCILKGRKLSIRIEPDTAYPYLQIYTPPHRKSIAIENLTAAPDAFNNKIGLIYLQPGEVFSCTTGYRLELS
jgi:aldose 1-epimerase